MSLFVFSVFAGLLFHQLISIIQPLQSKSARGRRLRIGRRVVILLSESAYLQAKTGLIVFLTLVFLVVILTIVAQGVHPAQGYAFRFTDALTSPRIASAILGGFVGFLIGDLINRVFRGPQDYQLKVQDKLVILLIIVLVVFGVGGEEFIRSYAARVTKISLGATNEITFSDASRGGNRSTEQVRNAYTQAGGAKNPDYLPGDSSGLGRASQIDGTIRRDQRYLRLLAKYEKAPIADALTKSLEDSEQLALSTIVPVANCLGAIYTRTGDKTFLNAKLAELANVLRLLPTDASSQDLQDELGERGAEIGKRAYDTALKSILKQASDQPLQEADSDFLTACLSLSVKLCASEAEEKEEKTWPGKRASSLNDCLRTINANEDGQGGNKLKARIKTAIGSVKLMDEVNKRPYFAIARAGLLVQMGSYEAAIEVLHDWVNRPNKNEKRLSDAWATGLPDAWYVIRARIAIGGYLEEWIRSLGESAPQALRQYQIDNWQAVIEAMKKLRAHAAMQKASGTATMRHGLFGMTHSGDEGLCDAEDGEREDLGRLYESYIGSLTGFVDHSLKHTEASAKNASRINEAVDELNSISLRCVAPAVRQELRAEILELYARNQLNLVLKGAPLRSIDSLREQLSLGQQALRLAIEKIDRPQSEERQRRRDDPNFRRRISRGDSLIERYESVLSNQEKLKEAERNLGQ